MRNGGPIKTNWYTICSYIIDHVKVLLHVCNTSYGVIMYHILNLYVNCSGESRGHRSLADLGGVSGAHPPMGPNSFIFAYIFTEKHPHRRSTPPYGKSWIHHCRQYMPPQTGPISFVFTHVSAKKHLRRRSVPLNRKSWIRS